MAKKTEMVDIGRAEVDGGSVTPAPKVKAKKPVVNPVPVVKDVPEDDAPPTDDKGNYLKPRPFKCGGSVKMAKGGAISSRGDGCCVKGKTKGRMY